MNIDSKKYLGLSKGEFIEKFIKDHERMQLEIADYLIIASNKYYFHLSIEVPNVIIAIKRKCSCGTWFTNVNRSRCALCINVYFYEMAGKHINPPRHNKKDINYRNKERPCLLCGRNFLSKSKGNCRCKRCNISVELDAQHSGSDVRIPYKVITKENILFHNESSLEKNLKLLERSNT